jgi:RNA polymerase sigma factor (sigma-70 family)
LTETEGRLTFLIAPVVPSNSNNKFELEGIMNNPDYVQPLYHYVISENSCLAEYPAVPDPLELTEEKIAAIRAVLQKLSTIRVLNPTDAEDLVQDTLLTMLTKYPGNELEKGLLIWSMGILRKKVGNYYRKAQRYTCLSEQASGEQSVLQGLTAATSPEAKFLHEELKSIIRQTLLHFPPLQRQAMELLLAGLNSGEIVKHLHPERYQNVINHIFRGRQKLAKELAKFGYGPNAKPGLRTMKRAKGGK